MKTEQDFFEVVSLRERYLTPSDWKQNLELKHQAEDRVDLLDGILLSWASMMGHDEHMQVTPGLCSSIGQVPGDERRLKDLYGPSVKLQSTDATLPL